MLTFDGKVAIVTGAGGGCCFNHFRLKLIVNLI